MIEARRADGNLYPASSILNLLAGLYRHCKEHDANCTNFMNRKDPAFWDLNGALQVRYRSLCESGVGAEVKHAVEVSSEEEDTLGFNVAIALVHVAITLAAAPLRAPKIAPAKRF